jgi:hypothetical protein
MPDFNLNDAIVKSAQAVKDTTTCTSHMQSPDYEIIETPEGANVKWTYCCENFKSQIEEKFQVEVDKNITEALNDALGGFFK